MLGGGLIEKARWALRLNAVKNQYEKEQKMADKTNTPYSPWISLLKGFQSLLYTLAPLAVLLVFAALTDTDNLNRVINAAKSAGLSPTMAIMLTPLIAAGLKSMVNWWKNKYRSEIDHDLDLLPDDIEDPLRAKLGIERTKTETTTVKTTETVKKVDN